MSSINEAVAFYDSHYENIGSWYLSPEKKYMLGCSDTQICRFCSKQSPEVTFRLDAHAIPESLGNKSLFLAYECDACNQLFGKTIENDFGNWSKPMRTFARIRGKKGIPTLKSMGTERWRIEYDNGNNNLSIKLYENNPVLTVDKNAKSVTFQLQRDAYTPVAVLKAFVKMGLSVLPETEMINFSAALNWIRNPDHQIGLVSEFPVIYSFVSGPMPNDKIVVLLYRRKQGIECVPYIFFILSYGNEVFQVFLPSPERDQVINGKKVELIEFPTPYDIYFSGYGPPKGGTLNLMGRGLVKDDILKLTMGFDKITG